MSNLFNFFAILHGAEGLFVRHIVLDQQLQGELAESFSLQLASFMEFETEVEFDGGYYPSEKEILVIRDFALGIDIQSVHENTLREPLNDVDLRDTANRLVALFALKQSGRAATWMFQSLTAKSILTRKTSILLSGTTFTKLTNAGLILQDNLAAVHQGKTLYFRSFSAIRAYLEVQSYYREASDSEIKDFLKKEPIDFDDVTLVQEPDSFTRKKIHGIHSKKIFQEHTPRELKKIAASKGIELTVKKRKGKDVLQLPAQKKDFKEALQLLDEDILDSPLSDRSYLSNSKRLYKK